MLIAIWLFLCCVHWYAIDKICEHVAWTKRPSNIQNVKIGEIGFNEANIHYDRTPHATFIQICFDNDALRFDGC